MPTATLEDTLSQLSPGEKLALIGRLWDTLDASELPVSAAVAAELDRRWAEYQRNPASALTLNELMARVEARRR